MKMVAFILALSWLTLSARLAPGAPGNSELPSEIILEQQRVSYPIVRTGIYLSQPDVALKKEPALGKKLVFRKLLKVGENTNNFLALIWDRPEGKLYLDLNRNLDLTDDSNGIFAADRKSSDQTFSNVALTLKLPSGLLPIILDLRFVDLDDASERRGRVYVQASLVSLWQAKVEFHGKPWQIGVVESPFEPRFICASQFLVLRPWSEITNRLSGVNPLTGCLGVSASERLFWEGEAFKVGRRWENRNGTVVCIVSLQPEQPKLADVTLAGQFLDRIILWESNGYSVMLRQPAGVVKIPQGQYVISGVALKKDALEAMRDVYAKQFINVTGPTRLVLGGPLTNSVWLNRQGRFLRLDYALVGADGAGYRLAQIDRTKPPEFTIYLGNKKLASGKFEFG